MSISRRSFFRCGDLAATLFWAAMLSGCVLAPKGTPEEQARLKSEGVPFEQPFEPAAPPYDHEFDFQIDTRPDRSYEPAAASFDAAYSNFGPLNCVVDPGAAARGVNAIFRQSAGKTLQADIAVLAGSVTRPPTSPMSARTPGCSGLG